EGDRRRRHQGDAVQQRQGQGHGVPGGVPQDAAPGRRGRLHFSPLTVNVEVTAGPFHLPAVAQTRQGYGSPGLSSALRVQRASGPFPETAGLLSPRHFPQTSSKWYDTFSSGWCRAVRVTDLPRTAPEGATAVG